MIALIRDQNRQYEQEDKYIKYPSKLHALA